MMGYLSWLIMFGCGSLQGWGLDWVVINCRAKVVKFCQSCASILRGAASRLGNCRLLCNYQIYSSIGAPKYLCYNDAAVYAKACFILFRFLESIRKDPSFFTLLFGPIWSGIQEFSSLLEDIRLIISLRPIGRCWGKRGEKEFWIMAGVKEGCDWWNLWKVYQLFTWEILIKEF